MDHCQTVSISKKTLVEEFSTSVTIKSIYFSDHDPVRIVIDKNVNFHNIPI